MFVEKDKFKPALGKVFVHNMEFGQKKSASGLVYSLDDDGKFSGVRPRWGQVFLKGSDITDVNVGDWVLLVHGQWTRRMKMMDSGKEKDFYMINWPSAVLVISKEKPLEVQDLIDE